MSEYVLQSRWRLEGRKLYYYGLRNRENLFHNEIRVSKKQAAIIATLPRTLSKLEQRLLGRLLGQQVVPAEQLVKVPTSLREAHFCTSCCANDFIIPGLEFDQEGRCPMCQTAKETEALQSLVPLIDTFPKARKSRFDVALFYTGGKDSTFLLYHLAKEQNLRVLALTWEIPFISASAKASIEHAKQRFPHVEFLQRTMSRTDLEKIYAQLYKLSGNTCACPSLAYLLFYPELVANRVPYFLVGNEPVQMLGLYYNHIAPKFAYGFAKNRAVSTIINMGRILTLHPPFRPFREGSAGAAPGDGRQHGPLFTAPPGCGIHSGNPLPEPPGGGCDFVLPGGGTGPGSSPGPEPVCRRLVSGGRGCPDLDGGGTAGANSRGGDLAQPKWGKGVSGQASGPAGTLGPVVGSAALAAPAAPVGCQSA